MRAPQGQGAEVFGDHTQNLSGKPPHLAVGFFLIRGTLIFFPQLPFNIMESVIKARGSAALILSRLNKDRGRLWEPAARAGQGERNGVSRHRAAASTFTAPGEAKPSRAPPRAPSREVPGVLGRKGHRAHSLGPQQLVPAQDRGSEHLFFLPR